MGAITHKAIVDLQSLFSSSSFLQVGNGLLQLFNLFFEIINYDLLFLDGFEGKYACLSVSNSHQYISIFINRVRNYFGKIFGNILSNESKAFCPWGTRFIMISRYL